MYNNPITKQGKLKKKYRPAVYLDTSVLFDYYFSEGLGFEEDPDIPKDAMYDVVRDIVMPQDKVKGKRLEYLIEIRKIVEVGESAVTLVYTPLTLFELFKNHTEIIFKGYVSNYVGSAYIKRMGDREVGNHIKRLLEEVKDIGNLVYNADNYDDMKRLLLREVLMKRIYTEPVALCGLIPVNITNFDIGLDDVWGKAYLLPVLQLSVPDILHIFFAEHLGCGYFASFDSGFERVKNEIDDVFGLSLISDAERLFNLVYREE